MLAPTPDENVACANEWIRRGPLVQSGIWLDTKALMETRPPSASILMQLVFASGPPLVNMPGRWAR